jgi:hypothetical protein
MLMKLSKLILAGAMLALPLTAVSPVIADENLDLVIDDGLIVPWAINNIAPGSSGVEYVDIRNAGNIDGYLAVWIDGITDTEGENPESETGDTEEPGELSEYLTLKISGNNIAPYTASSAFVLPVALDAFPQSVSAPVQLNDRPVSPGVTIQIQWDWAVLPQATNIIQGDRVSFNIHYVLTQDLLVPRPPSSMSSSSSEEIDTDDEDIQDDSADEISEDETEDIIDSDEETNEEQETDTGVKDTSGNATTIIPKDDYIEPTSPASGDSRPKIDLSQISSTKHTTTHEILSRVSLIVAIGGALSMTVLAGLERMHRNSRHVTKG